MSNVRELSERAALTQNENGAWPARAECAVWRCGLSDTAHSVLVIYCAGTIIHSATRYYHHIRTARSTLRD